MLIIDTGYNSFSLTNIPSLVRKNVESMYQVEQTHRFTDFSISMKTQSLFRRFLFPQVSFFIGSQEPFKPLPKSHSYPFLEWGMNWVTTSYLSTDLLIHAAVLEKDGKAVIFPAPPGSGKSTITAYLMLNGWRLLSDEMTIINLKSRQVLPSVRPVCLKNTSIDLVESWHNKTVLTDRHKDTHKGTVAHLRPTDISFKNKNLACDIAAIIFPKYTPGNLLSIEEIEKSQVMVKLIDNAFNFNTLGQAAFTSLKEIIDHATCFNVYHNDLSELEDFLSHDVI